MVIRSGHFVLECEIEKIIRTKHYLFNKIKSENTKSKLLIYFNYLSNYISSTVLCSDFKCGRFFAGPWYNQIR